MPTNDGAGAARAQCLYISKHGKKEFLKVQTRMHEKHDFQKVQEILGQDYEEALRFLEGNGQSVYSKMEKYSGDV